MMPVGCFAGARLSHMGSIPAEQEAYACQSSQMVWMLGNMQTLFASGTSLSFLWPHRVHAHYFSNLGLAAGPKLASGTATALTLLQVCPSHEQSSAPQSR